MKNEVFQLIEEAKRKEKYFKNYRHFAKKIKREVEKLIGKTKVYVFGSVLKKNEIPQDIDILIISPKFKDLSQRTKVLVHLWKNPKIGSPFELHFATPQEYKEWYSRFIDKKIEIK